MIAAAKIVPFMIKRSRTARSFRSVFTSIQNTSASHSSLKLICHHRKEIRHSQVPEESDPFQQNQEQRVAMFPFEIEKHYEPRGDWTLHRLVSATRFICSQCNKEKKAKLVATKHKAWDELCCNACYGQHLSAKP